MTDVLARLSRLEAIVAVQHLMFRYAECVDLARFEELGGLFGSGTLGVIGEEPIHGAGAIARFYAATNKVHGDGTLRTRHLASNAIIEVEPSGAEARARSYFVVLQATDAVPLQPIVAGRYHDRFRCADGDWTFAERVIFVDQIGNMKDHLSFDLARDPIPKIG